MMDTAGQIVVETSSISASSAHKRSRKQQRRSLQERRRIVEATLVAGASVAQVAEAYGVRASQVFQWRKLYREGRLGDHGVSSAKLVPVRFADATASEVLGCKAEWSNRGLPGMLYLELSQARVRLEGSVDPGLLRLVLEWLRP
jgi:transposase